MPRHDPLTPFSSRRPKAAPRVNPEIVEAALLRSRLHEAERAAAAAIRERDSLRRQLLQSGIRPKSGPRKRRPPEAGLPVPAVPPRGPLPLQGGAQAPLEFDD